MRLDHDPDINEAVLKRLILGRLAVLEQQLGGVGLMVTDDPVMAGEQVNSDGSKRWSRGGYAGQPDIRVTLRGRAFGIETKTLKGRKGAAQRKYQRRMELAGGVYVLARNLEQALRPIYDALGIPL